MTTTERTRVWTMREVEQQEAGLQDLRAKLEALCAEESRLKRAVADAVEAGDDPSAARAALREAQDLQSDLVAARPILEQRIHDRRVLAARQLARERLQAIEKTVGVMVVEADSRAQKVEGLLDELEDHLTWLANVRARETLFGWESYDLATRAGLEAPELPTSDVDGSRIVEQARRRLGAIRAPREGFLTATWDAEQASAYLARLYGEESPTPEILAHLNGAGRAEP